MGIETIRAFFMWCTILNGALLVISFLICASAGDWVYQMHSKWFSISRDTFNVALYAFLGVFKTLFFVFNVIPYVALLILG